MGVALIRHGPLPARSWLILPLSWRSPVGRTANGAGVDGEAAAATHVIEVAPAQWPATGAAPGLRQRGQPLKLVGAHPQSPRGGRSAGADIGKQHMSRAGPAPRWKGRTT